jgi:flagellar motility protein MotE (MotC chaperone)
MTAAPSASARSARPGAAPAAPKPGPKSARGGSGAPAAAAGAGETARKRASVPISTILVGLFVASALVRLAGGTAVAIAREVEDIAGATSPDTAPAAGPELAQEVDSILFELRQREEALTRRETDLALREQDLRAMSDLVGAQIARLSEAETRLRQVMSLAEGAAEGDVAQLTAVYAAMKPKEAAAVFEEMDPAFAAGFLGRMKPDAAAQIVAGLSPGKAYSISVILAGRNVGTPTE